MTSAPSVNPDASDPRKPLRLWPGAGAAALLVLVAIVLPMIVPQAGSLSVLGALASALAILLWWLLFSRAPWLERFAALGFMAAALVATRLVVHQSISNGMMGLMPVVFGIPLMSVALVASVLAARHLESRRRLASIAGGVLLACGLMTVVRTAGVSGEGVSDLHWRWTKTPEERLLAQGQDVPAPVDTSAEPATSTPPGAAETPTTPEPEKTSVAGTATKAESAAPASPAATPPERPAPGERTLTRGEGLATSEHTLTRGEGLATSEHTLTRVEWPGFRGPTRDGVVRGVRLQTDWTSSPPVEIWRRPIGPGWSSFAVRGDLFYTQEQRGNYEVVSAYRLHNGMPVWGHRDAVRFYESNAGPGPRATPTIHGTRIYTMGATGIVNALDARSGMVKWSRNAAADAGKEIPDWGLASSPLVFDDLVIVGVAGRLVAYDAATGKPRWFGPTGGGGYSSPHLATIDGVPQVLLLRGSRTISVAPADGTVLWEHTAEPSTSILQPVVTPDGGVLIANGDAMGGTGVRRISVSHTPGGWTVGDSWTSRGLKPYFNDYVVHNGYAYGFDGSILACIDLADGERKWKGGRYGHGQLLLLPDQDLLLVLSEEGELALVSATPDQFRELSKFKAIEGKTWNHPVLVGDVLLVRNGEEMAAFRLTPQ